MLHSTVTSKGQTTIPGEIRKALQIKPGDKLEYVVDGDHATIRVHPGTRSLRGVLASKKGKGLAFAQIREVAAKAARDRMLHQIGPQQFGATVALDVHICRRRALDDDTTIGWAGVGGGGGSSARCTALLTRWSGACRHV